jgi:hypothetical protein
MKRVNYLNNKDLLTEIHKSKSTYCSFVSEDDAEYDIILTDVKKINASSIAQARKNKAKRLTQKAWEDAKAVGGKRQKMSDFEVSPRKIVKTDLIFRVMTYEHIPLDEERKKNPRSRADHHSKVNFPPFQHYKLDNKGRPVCVGKSHWVGGMANGHFSAEHGKMTNKLAMMYMKLCERYGTRSNWRGYTYNDEMQAQALMQLSQIGLQFDESKSDNPFAYYTAAITNSFTRILNIEKKNQNIRDDIMEMNGMMPSYTRQAKNEEQAKSDREDRMEETKSKKKKKPEKTHYMTAKGEKIERKVEVTPVKVYTKKAIKLLNKKFKTTGKITSDDFNEVK